MKLAYRQPRPEHPKPQFYRDSWINLIGALRQISQIGPIK